MCEFVGLLMVGGLLKVELQHGLSMDIDSLGLTGAWIVFQKWFLEP